MKLSKETRDLVEVGDFLKDENSLCEIISLRKTYGNRGRVVSVQWVENNSYPFLKGRILYGEGLSTFYGTEIIKHN